MKKEMPWACKYKIMTETDIWIEVMKKIGLITKEEVCTPTSNILILHGRYKGVIYDAKIWFDLKSEAVKLINITSWPNSEIYKNHFKSDPPDLDGLNKEKFEEKFISIFRDVKLETIV